jgi:hypothetical protein
MENKLSAIFDGGILKNCFSAQEGKSQKTA